MQEVLPYSEPTFSNCLHLHYLHHCSQYRKQEVLPYSNPTFANCPCLHYHYHCSQCKRWPLTASPLFLTASTYTTTTIGPNAKSGPLQKPHLCQLPLCPLPLLPMQGELSYRKPTFSNCLNLHYQHHCAHSRKQEVLPYSSPTFANCPCAHYHFSQCRTSFLTANPLFPTASTCTTTTIAPNAESSPLRWLPIVLLSHAR